MALQRIDTAYDNPIRFNGNLQPQANANVFLGNTSNQFAGIYSINFYGTASNATTALNLSGGSVNGTTGLLSGNVVLAATTTSANVNTGALVVAGGVGIRGTLQVLSNIVAAGGNVSTSTTTGAIVVVGGVGVSGNINIGSDQGNSLVAAGAVSTSSNTQAVSNSTGALRINGGASFTTGNIYIGGSGGNAIVATGRTYATTFHTQNGVFWGGNNNPYLTPPTGSTGAIQFASAGAFGGASDFTYSSVGGNVVIGSTTLSTSTTTGALVITGGLATQANINIGSSGGNSIVGTGSAYLGNVWITTASAAGLRTNQSTAYVFNETASIVRIAGAGVAEFDSPIQAISTTTGAIQIAGGVSIAAGNLYIGGSGGNAGVLTGNVWLDGNLMPGGANVSKNLGSTVQWWNTFYGLSTQARYADLAENYQADDTYLPGTVLEFSGTAEVTIAKKHSLAVAGVVSTNPAHLMNGGLTGNNVATIALLGRVPCKVRGPVKKGDLLVSAGNGFAESAIDPKIGSVVGKALHNFDANEGIVEIVVGRL